MTEKKGCLQAAARKQPFFSVFFPIPEAVGGGRGIEVVGILGLT